MVYTITPILDHKARNTTLPKPMKTLNSQLQAGIPLYVQIAESLLDQIASGKLQAGHRLPAERELSETLGVNRMTLRQALHNLEMQGLLVRRQGDGTYVTDSKKIERQAGKLVPFTRGMQQRGFQPGAQVISFEQGLADSTVARELNLRLSAPTYQVHRLRLINQEPVMLERFALSAAMFPNLEKFDFSKRSGYEIFETEYGITIGRARQSLEAVIAGEYEAPLLQVKVGTPLMLETRLAYGQDGRPVEYGRDLYRGDRFKFITGTATLE